MTRTGFARTTIAALLSTLIAAPAAYAQGVCGKRDDIVAQLHKKYGETRRSIGLQQGRGVVELYASETTGSWTILVTNPRGMACLMAAGEAFEADAEAAAAPAAPI